MSDVNSTRAPEIIERYAFLEAAMQQHQQQHRRTMARIRGAGRSQRDTNNDGAALRTGPSRIAFVLRPSALLPFADWDFYCVWGGMSWSPNEGQTFRQVLVPSGFVTDLTSIPRIFWQVLRPEGRYAFAAVVHDYLYWTQFRPRAEADQIFKYAMQDSKVGATTMNIVFQAVRSFGNAAWKNNARLKQAGERRFLRFPLVPNELPVSWKEWKKKRDIWDNSLEATEIQHL